MGVSYTITSLAEFYREGGKEFLQDYGLDLPDNKPNGRYPTVSEATKLLENTPNFVVEYWEDRFGWIANIDINKEEMTSQFFEVRTLENAIGEKKVCAFHGDYELIKSFVENLSALCGPFVLLVDGEDPVIIGVN